MIVRVSTEINKENETFIQKGRGEILVLTQRIETEGKVFFLILFQFIRQALNRNIFNST